MKEDLVVGIIVFSLVVASAAAGVSTYMAKRDITAVRREIASVRASSAAVSRVVPTAPDTLPKANPVADGLVSDALLWGRGRLLVTASREDTHQLFNVDPTIGTRVETTFTVVQQSMLATISANGQITASGPVKASAFQNGGGSFVADGAGNVGVSSLVANSYSEFKDGVGVKGAFQAGSGSKRIYWDPVTGTFSVAGSLLATQIGATGKITRIAGEVRPDWFELASGKAMIDMQGRIRGASFETSNGVTAGGPVRASGFSNTSAGTFVVDPLGNVQLGGTLAVTGPSTFGGAVSITAPLTAYSLLVSSTAGVFGDLTVAGKIKTNNLRGGVMSVGNGQGIVYVPSMPATAGVTVTPRFSTDKTPWVTVAEGVFTVHSPDAGEFSWTVIW